MMSVRDVTLKQGSRRREEMCWWRNVMRNAETGYMGEKHILTGVEEITSRYRHGKILVDVAGEL
ncbi:hypothetical protein E2C01_052797 [Portunus trituberculatus]|uniref:Uncharacterized protein n=1 Tax=Portunus trituberculatus TaxID=210409 RepID=A0A5B7GP66_PORTR|nr:hypothetical protein [Portunus trituberculatus]